MGGDGAPGLGTTDDWAKSQITKDKTQDEPDGAPRREFMLCFVFCAL
jgi:hypothetical protein